jgi:molecular chaperone GrpE
MHIYTFFFMSPVNGEKNIEKSDELETQYNRLKEDFKDYIRSNKRKEAKIKLEMKKDISKRLLAAIDSLNRIIELDNDDSCEIMKKYSDNTKKNIEIIYNQMLSVLEISSIEPVKGDKFDEQKHTAVGLEYGTTYPENTIFNVIRKGYLIENNIIRPAEVIVMVKSAEQQAAKSGLWGRFLSWIHPAKLVFQK